MADSTVCAHGCCPTRVLHAFDVFRSLLRRSPAAITAGTPGAADVTLNSDRQVHIAYLFDSPVLRRCGRFFDLATALAGLVVLVILGPIMLYQAVTSRVPLKGELSPIEGAALACNPDIRGALVRIAGYERELRTQLDSCSKLLPQVPGHTVRISVYVPLSEMNAARRRGAIPSFGLTAEGETVHGLDADLTAARLDRVVLIITGIIATTALGWLGWVVASDPLKATRLFTGRVSTE